MAESILSIDGIGSSQNAYCMVCGMELVRKS